MNKLTVFQAHGRFFLSTGIGFSEVPFSYVYQLREQGTDVEIKEVEMHD